MKTIYTLVAFLILALTGCQQYAAKRFGGTAEIKIVPCRKVAGVTWKAGGSLWIWTRQMQSTEVAEEHIFAEVTDFGIMEGQVVLQEQPCSQ